MPTHVLSTVSLKVLDVVPRWKRIIGLSTTSVTWLTSRAQTINLSSNHHQLYYETPAASMIDQTTAAATTLTKSMLSSNLFPNTLKQIHYIKACR